MYGLTQAIYFQTLYVFTNIFLTRYSKQEMLAELRASDGILREFRRFLNKRHPNNPWLYYGDRY